MEDEKQLIAAVEQLLQGTSANSNLVICTRGPGQHLLAGPLVPEVAANVLKTSTTIRPMGSACGGKEFSTVTLNDAVLLAAVQFAVRSSGGGGVATTVHLCARDTSTGQYVKARTVTAANLAEYEDDCGAEGGVGGSSQQSQEAARGAVLVRKDGESVFTVSAATLSTTSRELCFCQFADGPQLGALAALVSQQGVKELLVHQTLLDPTAADAIEAVIGRQLGCRLSYRAFDLISMTPQSVAASSQTSSHVATTPSSAGVPSSQESAGSSAICSGLRLALREDTSALVLSEMPRECWTAANALVMGHTFTSTHCLRLRHVRPGSILRIDRAAQEGLNLVADNEAPRGGGAPTSIYGWLNRCSSSLGSRLLRAWLVQPSTQMDEITARLEMVEGLIENASVRDALLGAIRGISDIDRIGRKLLRRTCSLRELCQLKNFVASLSSVVMALNIFAGPQRRTVQDEYALPLEEMLRMMENLVTLLEATIETTADREYRINPAFDDELQALSTAGQAVRTQIDETYATIMGKKRWTDKICKCELHATYGFVLRVSRKDDKEVRDDRTFTVLNTAKDGVRFTTADLNSLSQEHKDVSRTYETKQRALHEKLIETVATYLPVIDDAKEKLARLDVLATWAALVGLSKMTMCRPQFTAPDAATGLSLVDLWHPLVAARVPSFVANSVSLGTGGSSNALIITGPNMGGKSTLMRSVGIATVLAHIGCYVPARSASLSVCDAVMCRVGASDFMSHGLSTFMVEMLETAAILDNATPRSLVLIDELGRGTSTYDGFGLAWAVARTLAMDKRALVLFSTHFHEMTELAADKATNGTVANAHFGGDASNGELMFSYALHDGPCLKSFGIEVAEHAKLPATLVADAKQRAAELETFAAHGAGQWSLEERDRLVGIAALVSKAGADPAALEAVRAQVLSDPTSAALCQRVASLA